MGEAVDRSWRMEVEIRDVVGCWRKRKQKGKKIRQLGLVALCLW